MEAFALTFADAPRARLIGLRGKVPMLGQNSPKTWIQVAVNGTWEGHPAGAFTFDAGAMDSIIANFKAQANSIPLTYEHPAHDGSGQPIPAAGWIHDMETRADGSLWAFVEFTDRAAGMIRAGEYRFCSVVVDFTSTDRTTAKSTGAEIAEVGLVNSPFLDGMQPITLSRRRRLAAGDKPAMKNDAALLKEAMKALGDEATLEKIIKWVEAKRAIMAIEAGDEPDPTGEGEAAAEAAIDEVEAGAPPAAAAVAASRTKLDGVPAQAPAAPAAPVVALQEGVDSPAGTEPDAAISDDDPAVMAAAVDVLTKLGEPTGMGVADVIAAIEGDLEAFQALVSGTPVDGTEAIPGDEAADAAGAVLSRARVASLDKSLAASRKATADATAEATKERTGALTLGLRLAVAEGKLDPTEVKTLSKFVGTSPEVVRARLEECNGDDVEPFVTPGKVIKASGAGNDMVDLGDDRTKTDAYKTWDGALKGSIPDTKERHIAVLQRLDTKEERLEKRSLGRVRRAS